MKVNVLYFAHLKTITQKKEEKIDLPNQSTLLELHQELKKKYPHFLDTPYLSAAINEAYTHFNTSLKEGDTVCFIPPVAGG
ncbi:MAG: molybdopterin converting factor subunit 1 [Deltaproteobacteria bacterium GWA2_38_16]|nr:MAG: molybdopterin converting factor subunit 1 [Deltaproteobacteria bacterium GWA2_38_16]OGQ02511.1 MAG: molybdopterin converting factor subunit 1 [Deltaproteobacteria bacterium RIFCSPHIGHO2_02_FULL_38_15]OGQ32181.1 MAG: molybdopterin converting factor subunit 1 [Deltaproteobacteria bacterium RIFCSPLOWO2_01_FULL_38_9]OGQ60232.1 MAG: molybdopterin converting factor subunit 1 [Deltaproteobacteria bacterium RIFCSPLOWO2_12_FULL_38_8]HBQ21033.1 molybdopterin converting factor subunit 1 [Deltaprot